MFDMEMMKEVGYCAGHRELLALPLRPRARASRRRACSTTCRSNALLVIDESHQTIPQLGAMYKRRPLAQGDAGGVRLPPALGARQPAAQVRGVGAARAADDLRLGDAGRATRPRTAAQVVEQVVRPTGPRRSARSRCARCGTQVDDVLSEIKQVRGSRTSAC